MRTDRIGGEARVQHVARKLGRERRPLATRMGKDPGAREFDAMRLPRWLPTLGATPGTTVLSCRARYVHSYSGLVTCPSILRLREHMRTERVCHYSIHGKDVVGAQRFAGHALLFDEPLRNELI